jgi:hypothetical protein
MVFVTQQLVIRHNLRSSSTLTYLHDSNTAWQGLVAALLTLWRQKAVRSRTGLIILATVYLGGIAALHITIPALASIEVFNITTQVKIVARGRPYYGFDDM